MELKTLKDIDFNFLKLKCHDCGYFIGEFHNENCDEVTCKYCHSQALSCDCKQTDKFHTIIGTKGMDFRPEIITRDELREEAIRWIKELEKYEIPIKIGYDEHFKQDIRVVRKNQPQGDIEAYHIRIWIKHFFNITEEDLKEAIK